MPTRSPSLLIVADDLTGALDTSAPFALHGMRVRVALDADGLAEALADSPDVVAVSTRSRGGAEADAVRAVESIASAVDAAAPPMIFKKVDSRLQGHPGAETIALAKAFARPTLVVAPAVPDQDRFTEGGKIVGRGVSGPIAIADAFSGADRQAFITSDVRSADDLTRIARDIDWSTSVAVGARGLGAAVAGVLAARLGLAATPPSTPFSPSERSLIAFGSRDPITEGQVSHLAAARPDLAIVDAPHGKAEPRMLGLPLLIRCTGDAIFDAAQVAAQFARTAVGFIRATGPQVAVIGGGDTAAAILSDLDLKSVELLGEALPGMPYFEARLRDGARIAFITKSGGFGQVDALCHVIPTS